MELTDLVKQTITILDGTKVSDVLQLEHGYYPSALILPEITTSTALNFDVGVEEDDLHPLHTSGSAYALTIAAATICAVVLDPDIFSNWRYIKISVADNQTGDKVIQVISRPRS